MKNNDGKYFEADNKVILSCQEQSFDSENVGILAWFQPLDKQEKLSITFPVKVEKNDRNFDHNLSSAVRFFSFLFKQKGNNSFFQVFYKILVYEKII